MLRSLLERLSRGVILKRRLPEQFNKGALFVSPDSALSYWRRDMGRVDPELLEIALDHIKPGYTVWDIGANVGLFTFASANLAGPTGSVLAVEADVWLCNLLSKSKKIKSNARLNIDILPVAAAESTDIVKFNIARRGRAASHIAELRGTSQAGGVRETKLVPCLSLDFIASRYNAPDFLKIDVEGAETLVLKGAGKLLSEARPGIYCEVAGKNRDAVTDILRSHNYKIFDAALEKPRRTPLERAVWYTLAYPA